MKTFIIGNGGWGTALGMVLAGNGHQVKIWGPFENEIQEICRKELNTLWDETRRFANPQEVYVDLSDELYQIKSDLLKKVGQAYIE